MYQAKSFHSQAMQAQILGKTPLKVSRIALGSIAFGGHYGIVGRYECIRTIQAAVEGGVTLFDTSPSYGGGLAEEILGNALGAGVNDLVIASKIGAGIDSTGQFWCLNNRPNILRQIEKSLARLHREYIDLYFIPGDDPQTPIGETVTTLEELRERGKIRFIGYCTSNSDRLREALKHGRIDVVQTPYNILERSITLHLIPFCRATRIPIIACEPYCRGLLTGKLHKHSSFDLDDLRIEDKRFRGEQFRTSIETVNRLRAYADAEELSLVQLAIGWIRQNPMIACIVTGAKSRLQIRQSIVSSDVDLTPEQVIAVDQIVGSNVPQRTERIA
jgi:myo-inositol catabolism protein IolS